MTNENAAVGHRYNDHPVTPFYDRVSCSCGWVGRPHSKINTSSMWREAHLHARRDKGRSMIADDIAAINAAVARLAELGLSEGSLRSIRDAVARRLCQIAGCESPREVTATLRDGSVVATCYRHEIPR